MWYSGLGYGFILAFPQQESSRGQALGKRGWRFPNRKVLEAKLLVRGGGVSPIGKF